MNDNFNGDELDFLEQERMLNELIFDFESDEWSYQDEI
jgi:hypothetical protein